MSSSEKYLLHIEHLDSSDSEVRMIADVLNALQFVIEVDHPRLRDLVNKYRNNFIKVPENKGDVIDSGSDD